MKLASGVGRLGTESAFEVLARAKALELSGRSIINLGIGQPDFQTAPHIVEAACKALRDGHHGYTPANGIPQVREADGLAMSSRNAYLGAADRERALALSRALRAAEERAREESLAAAIEAGRAELAAAGIEPEYLEARDPDDLTPVAELNGGPVLLAVAARVGGARLIDNVLIQPHDTRA